MFVGAGLSMQAGLPSWHGLLDHMVDELEESLQPREVEELKDLLGRGKLLEVAEYCKSHDNLEFNRTLKKLVRGDRCEIPESHRILARRPKRTWRTG